MDQAISFLSEELNGYLKNKMELSEDPVRIGRLINQDGTIPLENQNKLVLSLVSLSQETIKAFSSNQVGFTSRGVQMNQQPLHYNLEILLAAVFDAEKEGLALLSKVVEFFHENAYFNEANHPNLPKSASQITLEIVNLSLQDADALWGSIGAKSMPSVLYRVRVISIPASSAAEIVPPVSSGTEK